MAYLPIENYGVIGNLRTVALVGINGSIDWLCFPHFDSPSIFGAILDEHKGGQFIITPTVENPTRKQFYWPDTNILVTRFLCGDGVGEIVDYMPPGSNDLIRRVRVMRGEMAFRMTCRPAFNYARDSHRLEITQDGACFFSNGLTIALGTTHRLQEKDGGVEALLQLHEDNGSVIFCLHLDETDAYDIRALSDAEEAELFTETVIYWRHWLSQCTYEGRWRDVIYRSALILKLLTFEPTGAIVAAPTTSLPENPGGQRNWDYRYAWVRDAAFTLYALMRIGFTEEARHFIEFIEARCKEVAEGEPLLQIMYRLNGGHDVEEVILEHLEGYKGAKPVRIGNDAQKQRQMDIYGELMDAVYLYNKYGKPISYDLWLQLRRMLDWVCDHWQEKDHGIWEIRGEERDFIYSKLMCWVALDRGIRLADKRSFPADRAKWMQARDAIYESIMEKGWSEEHQAFTQYYGSDTLDAATLIMPLVFFVSPVDPRMLKTLDAIKRPPDEGGLVLDSLVYRYNPHSNIDSFKEAEGTFNMCTFWLVEALTRAGRVEEARLMFERMMGYANHLGLFAEETGTKGEMLGNFPQAFTHLALISAAFNLNRALGDKD